MKKIENVLIVGATGHLGQKVATEAIRAGYKVRVLIRPGSDGGKLVKLGAKVVMGNLLDCESLESAVAGCDAVITTAIGYSNRKKGDFRSAADRIGNRNLIDSASKTNIQRFVFCSVLTCDQAPLVPHFWDKKLVEDYLEEKAMPFISLRPGAFLDQGTGDFWAAGLKKGILRFAANPAVPLTFLHTSDLAIYFVKSLGIKPESAAEKIDIGCDRAVSIKELAEIMARFLERPIRVQVPPWSLVRLILGVGSLFNPWLCDLLSMMAYIQKGGYVADTKKQKKYFGEPPSIEASIQHYLSDIKLLGGSND